MRIAGNDPQFLTPNAIAQRFGVKPSKVIGWILSGELKAMDVSAKRGKKPRYKCSLTALELFEAARAVVPTIAQTVKPVRSRRRIDSGDIDYFAKA